MPFKALTRLLETSHIRPLETFMRRFFSQRSKGVRIRKLYQGAHGRTKGENQKGGRNEPFASTKNYVFENRDFETISKPPVKSNPFGLSPNHWPTKPHSQKEWNR